MESASLTITHCPPAHLAEALALVLSEIAPSQRREMARSLLELDDPADLAQEGLSVALRGDQLCGSAWGQRQSGNIAVFWPPQLVPGEPVATARLLADAVARVLDNTGVEIAQTLLPAADAAAVPVLQSVGFTHLADLLYMSCEADRFPAQRPHSPNLDFEPYSGNKRARLVALVERTYEQTLDCVGLDGMRTIDDVVTGYQNTGVYHAENWLMVRNAGQDVGLLLLADHPNARHWELMYMGLVPEMRGRGWGAEIARYAMWMARKANVERIVLAVDSTNTPALRMYRTCGFEIWDRRAVYVRFPAAARG